MCTAGAGAAIAPPPSLTETSEPTSGQDNDEAPGKSGNAARGLGVAAKIMAKYGYKVSIMTLQLDWNLAMEFNSSFKMKQNEFKTNIYSMANSNLVAHFIVKLILWDLVIEMRIDTLSPAQVGFVNITAI